MKNNSMRDRIQLLQKELKETHVLFEEYYDLYYLTDVKFSKATLIIGKNTALFVDGRYKEVAERNVSCPVFSPECLSDFLKKNHIKRLEFDPSKTTYERYQTLTSNSLTLIPKENPLEKYRLIKTKEEIKAIQKSADLLMEGFKYICSILKAGMTEEEVAKKFEIFCLEKGAERLAFESIIAFGANSAMPHHRAGKTVLKNNTLVLVDIGIIVDEYASDMTRTIAFGKIPKELSNISNIVRAAHREALECVREGVSAKELDRIARDVIAKHCDYPILHGLGHGVGLEVHESPRLNIQAKHDMELKENMVITIEPGIYIPGLGGIRYEDMILVQKKGFKNFYKNLTFDRV